MEAEEIELSIIMPCLNEAETLAICIRKAWSYLKTNNMVGEVVIGDNGSNDGSQQIAIRENARVVQIPEKGYGAALMGAMGDARGKYIIMGDSDDSYDFEKLGGFVEKLREGYDLVMGNRFKGEIKPGAMPFLHKYLGNPVLSNLGRLFFNIPIGDFHCGLRGFRKDSIVKLGLLTTGMEFASEMVVKSAIFHLKITEVSTDLSIDGRTRPPHLRTWRDGWRHLRFLLMYSPRWLFLYPGAAVFVLSSLMFLAIIPGPLHIGRVVLDLNSMGYLAAFMIVSFQIILFYIMCKIYAINQGLIPINRRLNRIFNYFTIERGLLAGGLLIAAGFTIMLLQFLHWKDVNFGNLTNLSENFRLLISSVILLLIGTQIVFSSFVFSILGIIKKERFL